MRVCLIIINYNGLFFLDKYIPSLKQSCGDVGFDLFVTDDLSTDESIYYLKSQNIEYTSNLNNNHGFASNVNNGLKFAQLKNNYDFYLISNNDVDFKSIDFKLLKSNLTKVNLDFKKIGLIGFKESNIIMRENLKSSGLISETNEIPGFFFAISKELVQEIGYLDEEYYMYGEDNDYIFRTLKADYKIVQIDQYIIHQSEGSTKNKYKTSWLVYRNAGMFAVKNLSLGESIRYFLSFVNIILNPFYKSNHPSYKRVKRSGILINLLFLIGSIFWNSTRMLSNFFKSR